MDFLLKWFMAQKSEILNLWMISFRNISHPVLFLCIVSGNPCKTEQSSFIVRKLSTFRQKIMWILYFREIHRNWDIRHDFILAILLWHNHTCEHSYIVLVYFLYLSPLLTQYFNFCSFQIERMENRFVFIWTIFFFR